MSPGSAPALAHHRDGALTHQCDLRDMSPGRGEDKVFQGWVDTPQSEKSGNTSVLVPISSPLPDHSSH